MLTFTLVLFPLLAGLAVMLTQGRMARQVALAAAVAEFLLTAYMVAAFQPNATTQFAVSAPWVRSMGLQFAFGIDGISVLLVLLTGLLVPLIILSTTHHTYQRPAVFYGLILLMQGALMGVFTARDAFLFYLFFEAALIPIYFIAALWGGENRIQVTLKFFVYTLFGSLFMLLALVYLYMKTPAPHNSLITSFYQLPLTPAEQGLLFWAFFVAFAVKMPLFPFHTWQPDTYVTAPTPGTMLLAGIMLKMGTYGLLRLLLPIVPLGVEKWGRWAMVLALIGIVYGSLIAIRQRDMKRLVAYSSFAHVGLMAAGIFSLTLDGLQGSLIQMLSHGINVVGLFFVIEIIFSRTRTRDLDDLGGLTRYAPMLTIFFMILLLGSVALPLTNGFVGEFLLLRGVFEYNAWMGLVAATTMVLGSVYMLRMMQKSMFGPENDRTTAVADLTWSERLVLVPLCAMVLWMGLFPNQFLHLTEPAVIQLLQTIGK